MVGAISAFISRGPDDYRRVIEVSPHHPLDPIKEAGGIAFGTTDAVVEGMALNVCLVHYIEAITVAKLIPTLIIGIVAGPYCIEVVSLHQ